MERAVNLDRRRDLEQQAERFHAGQVLGAMQAIRTALQQLQQNVNPRLALEAMMLDIPSTASSIR